MISKHFFNFLFVSAKPTYTRYEEWNHLKYGAPPKPPRAKQPTPVIFKLAWLLFNLCISVCPFITVVYWLLVRDGEWLDTSNDTAYAISYAIDVHTHAGTTFFVYLDLFISGTPVRMAHMVYGIIFGLLYIAFTAVYWYLDGTTPEGDTAIYSILDWSNPTETGYYIIGALGVLCVLHILGYLLYRLRMGCFNCCCIPKAKPQRPSRGYIELNKTGQNGGNFGHAPLAREDSFEV